MTAVEETEKSGAREHPVRTVYSAARERREARKKEGAGEGRVELGAMGLLVVTELGRPRKNRGRK